jgi:selenocysteine-specific elongation factor
MADKSEIVIAHTGEGALAYSSSAFERMKDRLVGALEKFHKTNQSRAGLGREELRNRVARDLPDRPWRNLLDALREQGLISLDGDTVSLGGHHATLTPELESLSTEVVRLLEKSQVPAPFLPGMSEELRASPKDLKTVLNLLAERGEVFRIKDDYFITAAAHETLIKGVNEYFGRNQEMGLSDFRGIVNTTRKWMIPLLEYLDRTQVTMRKGDVRIKRGSVKREQ